MVYYQTNNGEGPPSDPSNYLLNVHLEDDTYLNVSRRM